MDSSVATDPNNAKDYTDVHLERIMKSIEKEAPTDVGSSGATADVDSLSVAADVGSIGAVANFGSSEAVVAEEKLTEKKQKRIKLVATKGQGKKVKKGLKEKQMIKLEEMKSSNKSQGLKSHVHGTLHGRMSPSSIVQVMESFSENQLKADRDIGFGSIEFLKVTQLPLQLGLWLVQHFDANTCSLNIPNSNPFRITEDHVHQVLGLPIGGIEIDKSNFSRNSNVINQWKKQFQSNSLFIKIGELKEFLKGHKSTGAMFKRNFVVLCVSTLLDGQGKKYSNFDIHEEGIGGIRKILVSNQKAPNKSVSAPVKEFSNENPLQSIVVVAEKTTEPGSMEGKAPSSVVNRIARKGVGGSDPSLVKDKLGKRSRES
uniref:Uncharacterized protein n=1 Tax=Chenopodium quinoa TaxID=63459 RepID=A0A803N831_CHEQI